MSKKFFSGDTVEQAVLSAARYFQLDPEAIAFEPVERRHGFLRVRRRSVISVDPERPAREETMPSGPSGGAKEPEEAPRVDVQDEALDTAVEGNGAGVSAFQSGTSGWEMTSAPEPEGRDEDGGPVESDQPESVGFEPAAEAVAPAGEPLYGDDLEAAREGVARLLALAGLELSADVSRVDEKVAVELRGGDEDKLLEDRGRNLLAIQHLLPRMLRGLTGRSVPCWVDCDNFHEIRTEQLRDLAQRVASQVRRDRRMQTLEPMSPDERRIVHLTLSDDPAVETVSRGQGLFKRVQVKPVRLRPKGFDPYNR